MRRERSAPSERCHSNTMDSTRTTPQPSSLGAPLGITRTCSHCKQALPLSSFGRDSRRPDTYLAALEGFLRAHLALMQVTRPDLGFTWIRGTLTTLDNGYPLLLDVGNERTCPQDIAAGLDVQIAATRFCRVCGGTQEQGCLEGCWWVAKDLCSVCQSRQEDAEEGEDPVHA